jgi:signal transduction histidine kinase
MNAPAPSTPTIARRGQPGTPDRRLDGRWLVIVRVIWVVMVGFVIALFIASISTYAAFLHTLTTGVVLDLNGGQLTQEGVRALHAVGLSVDFYAMYHLVLNTFFVFGFLTVACMLFWYTANDRMAVFASFVLVTAPFGVIFQPATLPSVWSFPVHCIAFFSGMSLGLFFYLFPSGSFVPPWTRWLMIGWVIHEGITDFLPFPSFYFLTNGLFFALLVSVLAVQVYRYRRVSTPFERQQTRWVVFGCTVAIVGFLSVIIPGTFFPAFFQPGTLTYFVGETAISLFLLCIPLSIGIAILRFRLWDIDLVINRALVYGLLTACVLGMYVLVVGYLGALFRAGGNLFISLLATGLVAVFFQPLRERLQRGVNRLMYGERDEPYAVVTRLSQRLEGTLAPESVLPTIVETVAQALKLPYAAILLQQDDTFAVVASYGTPIDNPLVLSLTYQGETIGQLLLAARTPGDAFTAGDRRLLDELARHAGLAAHAVQLTADLQRSRERLVTAREEERRRLRRDLHDGLGSVLTSVMFKLDASDELLDRDPVTARALLAEVRAQTQASIDDIRRLVYNLRPPILDEWGLVAALREHVAQYNFNTVQVSIDATSSFPPLPAALEVAVYRVVLEALANVIKHAMASTCTIRLDLMDDALTVEVQDDGVGRPAGCHSGVGTAAMSERAEELGGVCVVEEAVPHGTRVFARFPVRKE